MRGPIFREKSFYETSNSTSRVNDTSPGTMDVPFDFALSLTFVLFSPWEHHSHWVHLLNIWHTSAQLARATSALLLSLIMTHASDSFTLHASLRFSLYSPGSFLHCVCVCMVSYVQLFATPWTVVHQAPLCMEFSRGKYWSGLPFPAPGDLPNPGIEAMSPALAGGFFTTEPPGKSFYIGFIKHLQCMSVSTWMLSSEPGPPHQHCVASTMPSS